MVYEFGTLDSQTLMGGAKSVQIMVAENQAYNYGCVRAEDMDAVKRQFKDMFYPESAAWRSNAIEKSRLVFDEIIPRL